MSVDVGVASCCSSDSAFSRAVPDLINNGEEASDKKSWKFSGVSSAAEDTSNVFSTQKNNNN